MRFGLVEKLLLSDHSCIPPIPTSLDRCVDSADLGEFLGLHGSLRGCSVDAATFLGTNKEVESHRVFQIGRVLHFVLSRQENMSHTEINKTMV